MTDAERQRRRRSKLRTQGLKPIWVKGTNGAFDPRLHLAVALKTMVVEGDVDARFVKRLVTLGGRSASEIPTSPERKYMEKTIRQFLGVDEDGRRLDADGEIEETAT